MKVFSRLAQRVQEKSLNIAAIGSSKHKSTHRKAI